MVCQKLFILIPISKKIFPMPYSFGNKIENILDMLHLGENSRTPGRNTTLHIDMFLRIPTTSTVLKILIRHKMLFSFVLSTIPYQGLQSTDMILPKEQETLKWTDHKRPLFHKAVDCRVIRRPSRTEPSCSRWRHPGRRWNHIPTPHATPALLLLISMQSLAPGNRSFPNRVTVLSK